MAEEAVAIDTGLDAIKAEVEGRAQFREEDCAIAGCIAIIGRDGILSGMVGPGASPGAIAELQPLRDRFEHCSAVADWTVKHLDRDSNYQEDGRTYVDISLATINSLKRVSWIGPSAKHFDCGESMLG